MRPTDTTRRAHAAHLAILRGMHPDARLAAGLALSDALNKTLAAGIRQRHPEYDERDVNEALIRLRLGDENCARIYPDRTLPKP